MTRPTALPVLLAAVLAVLTVALLAAACAANPNEHIEADEYFRPPAPNQLQRETAQQTTEQAAADSDQQSADQQQTDQTDQPAESQQQSTQTDPQSEPADSPEAEPADQDAPEDPQTGPARAEDITRRYLNPSYGYSLELICPPFCNTASNGIDRATFLADSGRALFEVRVSQPVAEDQLDDYWRDSFGIPDFVETPQRSTVPIPLLGLDASRYDWEEDRRATGGFLVQWWAVFVETGGLLYQLRGGAVSDDYEASLPALNRAFDSFIAPAQAQAAPGRYERFDFLFDYGTSYITLEYGVPTTNPATFDAGIVVLQSELALEAVLVWETIGAAFVDLDVAIERSLQDALGVAPQSDYRDARSVNGNDSRLAFGEIPFGEGVLEIAAYSWYCPQSGREFSLHVLHADDPEAAAQILLDNFRCQIEGAS